MRVTIKDIARLANVSRTTVYRALENKPGINPLTKEHVLKITEGLNYKPNRLGKALAKREKLTFGVVTLPVKNPFSKELMEGISEAKNELLDFGLSVQITSMQDLRAEQQAKRILEFVDDGVDGIAIDALNSDEVVKAVDRAVDAGIPVITFNSDLLHSKRLCFVGQNLYRSGQVAADLLARFMGEKGDVFVLSGFHEFRAHQERLEGFRSVMQDEHPGIEIVAIEESLDDDIIAYEKTMEALKENPDITGVYAVAAGVSGMGGAVKNHPNRKQIKVISNDLIPETVQLLQEDVILATIIQDPFSQGKLPVCILFEMLYENKKPSREFYYTKTEIVTKHLIENSERV